MRMNLWKLIAAGVAFAASTGIAADPAHYVKKASWPDTLMASREALAKHEADQLRRATKHGQAGRVVLGTWHAIGAFRAKGKRGFGFAFPPEKKIELGKRYGRKRWRAMTKYRDGVVHTMRAGSNSATYLYRTITAPAAQQIMGHFGSDDGIVAWLNGKKILSRDVPRGPGPNQDHAKLPLKKGENHLLLKIYNISGGHGFYFSIWAKPGGRNDPAVVARQRLWELVARDFADADARRQMQWERQDGIWSSDWKAGDLATLGRRYVGATRIPSMASQARAMLSGLKTPADLHKLRLVYYRSVQVEKASAIVGSFNFQALRLAVADLTDTFEDKYPKGKDYLKRLDALEKTAAGLADAATKGDAAAVAKLAAMGEELSTLRTDALLANPLIDFDKLLLVKRSERNLGLPHNWVTNASVGRTNYDNELATLSPVSPTGQLATLYKPDKGAFVGDVDLHWDADRMLFSSIGAKGRWQVFEMKADGTGVHQVTPGREPDVDNFDACYVPNGTIIFASTRAFQGVPCVGGGSPVANLVVLDPKSGNERQLCFDQDQNWCPTVLNNGRILYTRWEYSDTPHYFSRILFHMNPDGSEQMEYAFSNSYWPNSTFYARPIPGHPTKVVAIVSGHHGVPRMGELIVYDPARGRHETSGAVQRIPGHGKEVPPTIRDQLVNNSWPKFLHPYPLSGKYFLVSCKPTPQSQWGIYLVDVFDNMLLLQETPGYALFEPVPLRKTTKPPVVPDKVDPSKRDAIVYLSDVYIGRGLKGVPRGVVKKLRVYEYHYGYNGMGGHIHIGIDGPWDVHRIHGTVPVFEDGSAIFKAPANIPISVQPLDAEGKAVQLFRSWYTPMPGEVAMCVGCHERQNTTPPLRRTNASTHAPCDIEPWRGPSRGFSFTREIQPVLDKHCVGCHNDKPRTDGKTLPNFADTGRGWRGFTKSYIALHPFVRRPGPESDYRLQKPCEWHADTSELIQMLQKGHKGVRLDAEAWDRLVTWIDLNVPNHGTWSEYRPNIDRIIQRRLAMRTKYANRPENPEVYPTPPPKRLAFVKPGPMPEKPKAKLQAKGWPFDAAEAKKRQAAAGHPAELKLDLGEGVSLDLALVPAGSFVMGDADGYPDEWQQAVVAIDKPFYLGKVEVTNAQFARFDPDHDSGVISVFNKDQNTRGIAADRPNQPVIRVAWKQAVAFCYWLSKQTGRTCTLPTEAQWEWACRAGAATPMSYGAVDANFGRLANMADKSLTKLCRRDSPKWIPCIGSVNDGAVATADVGRYAPNAWGLCDMHCNAAEWTLSLYRPYPYRAGDGRNDVAADGRRVARGGSFYDRPKRCRSGFRLGYRPWQPVYNTGLRVLVAVGPKKVAAAK